MAFFTSSLDSNLTTSPIPTRFFLPPKTFRNREFRVYRRRRLKLKPFRNELDPSIPSSSSSSSSPFEFLSLFPFDWIPPLALGFASALALSISNRRKKFKFNTEVRVSDSDSEYVDIGEWILFTSPTPFNRFVLLRCPSISFEGGEFLEDVSDKLVKEEKHFVRLDSGRIQVKSGGDEGANEGDEYQRECVMSDDGGVISLDWPANLDLSEEHGLDTVVLLIPGTSEGSMDENVRGFVSECLRRGLFPVVMNPRGCAGSPLTTARLFTAADSDDVNSAIQFITRARPWSTLMSVGWGYGANMLTKYLAEAGEKTPLTAATCINNPFDLDEATRTTPYSTSIDKKLTAGVIDILRTNKELFQGRRKGFDVEKALFAESVRDFEEAISMVSYGFDTIEEFYASASTRSMVGELKIPVLFVQDDDGTVPLFSIPRTLIAENPFTSLLLCSCLPSNITAISWYQQVTIEWLMAVELGLLKGRHPLLRDIDVTINPSKGLALVEGRTSGTNNRADSVLNLSEFDSSVRGLFQGANGASRININSNRVSQGLVDPGDQVFREISGVFPHTTSVDASSVEDVEDNPEESDRGQVLQTAQVVMNMLDVTMPGTLKEEEKRKVVEAVGQGENLIKALQDAVPEDVCGKLTNSVSEILQAQGKNLNFDALRSVNQIADSSSGLRSKIKLGATKDSDGKPENNDHPSEEKVSGHDLRDSKANSQSDMDKLAEVGGALSEEKSVQSSDVQSKSVNGHDDNIGSAKVPIESQNSDKNLDSDLSSKNVGQLSEVGEEGCENIPKMGSTDQIAGSSDSGESGIVNNSRSQDVETNQLDVKESNMSERVGDQQDSSYEQSKTSSPADNRPADTNESPAPSISESQQSDKGNDDSNSKDEKPVQPDHNTASVVKSPAFSVSQALDALSGLDDSTQVAVNSVFGVIEDMITQLEERKNEGTAKKGHGNNGAINHSVAEKTSSGGDDLNGGTESNSDGHMEDDPTAATGIKKDNMKENLVTIPAIQNADKPSNNDKLHLYKKMNPCTEAFYNECLRKYILSKVQQMKPLYLDTKSALFLDYNPEEGNWLLLEQPGGDHGAMSYNNIDRMEHATLSGNGNSMDNIIEPSYVILDSESQEEPSEEERDKFILNHDHNFDESKLSAKTVVLDTLKVEVSRRLAATGMEEMETELEADLEEVANAVYFAVQDHKEHDQHFLYSAFDDGVQGCSEVRGKQIIEAISPAVQNTRYLKRVLPVGVIVGSSLAALRNFLHNHGVKSLDVDPEKIDGFKPKFVQEASQLHSNKIIQDLVPVNSLVKEELTATSNTSDVDSANGDVDNGEKDQSKTLNKDTLMVGAVTAALGATALLRAQQEDLMESDNSGSSSSLEMENTKKEIVNMEESEDNKHQSNIITSLAEKAMSVAAPVVPTKEGGEVDQERLVAMLAELGQKGGVLRLVAKLALLWGGLRGAMSLTDRLISFLRISERPLLQRVLGFFSMVLVLWSPVLVPLLPTLFHSWATHSTSRIAELACILGLYAAVTILIMQWGKRIRGHEYPLKQYGLDLVSPRKTQEFLTGLVGGITLVVCIHSVNILLSFVNVSLPSNLSSSSLDLTAKIKVYGQLILLACQGFVTAAGVALVEELLFRSWLLEEIAVDLGYHSGILLAGLVFSLSQRSLMAIPGLWLLSMCLAGARLRTQGSLFIPIGMRTGIMSLSYILHMGGFLIYQPKLHPWIAGVHPLQPFGGIVGLVFALFLAIVLYPRQLSLRERFQRIIRA